METNESLKTALLQEAEMVVLKLIDQLQSVTEGDFKDLEHTIMTACLSVGKGWLEQVLNHPREENRSQARR